MHAYDKQLFGPSIEDVQSRAFNVCCHVRASRQNSYALVQAGCQHDVVNLLQLFHAAVFIHVAKTSIQAPADSDSSYWT